MSNERVLGKTIRIYLADGSPTGIRHAEMLNWTGQAIVCPRTRLSELGLWDESKRPGVYVLFGEDPAGPKPLAYIGEAENVLDRLQSHVKQKDFWDRVVFFTSKDANLTKAHVKYLECRFVQLAQEAARVKLENGNLPQMPRLPRADQDAMEEFLDPSRILLGALGFAMLQPLPSKPVAIQTGTLHPLASTPGQARAESAEANPLAKIPLFLRIPKRGVDAQGASSDDGFVVFKDSIGETTMADYMAQGWRDRRDELIADGSIIVVGTNTRFTRDVLFSSPSAAATIVAGGNRNGRDVWKDGAGKSLKVLELELLAIPSPPPATEDEVESE